MGMFDSNKDYGVSNYLREEGDFFLVITSVEYDDTYFPKYNIMAEVASGEYEGKLVQGQITKPTEKFMKDEDRALGGFSFAQVGKYVVGAGITDEVNALEKITVGVIAKMLVGKTIKAHVQLTDKSRKALNDGETTGIFYEIGKVYKRVDWADEDIEAVPAPYNMDGLTPPDDMEASQFPF